MPEITSDSILAAKDEMIRQLERLLEIEAALESVRTVAMSMDKADDLLKISEIQFNELRRLGFTEIRNALIGIFNDEKNYFTDYDYSDFSGGSITNIPYNKNPVIDRSLKQMKSATDAFTEFIVEGDELEEWKAFRKQNGEYDDTRLKDTKALYYYFYSISSGNVGISTFKKISEEQLAILKRFRNVFDLAYKRYVDISNAEAQAREAQIELGLERVRARAMAMHHSEELSELVAILFDELVRLELILTRCIIWIFDADTLSARLWMANSEDKKNAESYYIQKLDHPYYDAIIRGWKERNPKWVYDLGGEEKRTIDELLLHETELSSLPEVVKKGIQDSKHTIVSGSFNNFGLIEASGPLPHSEEQLEILNRFGKVFDLSYTRFNDLQKAESQAREAQIEASLERVRSRSMGMQKSEELKEVIQIVYEQFIHLNIQIEHAGFIVDYKERDDMHIWLADKHEVPSEITIPYFDSPHWNSFMEAKTNKKDFFSNQLSFDEKNKFYHDLFKLFPVPVEAKEYYFTCPGLAISTVLLDNVGLYIENFLGIPYTDEENSTLMRFGKVFQQTYTRFLDLQKAEAQSREAEIELALERVRAKAMAMRTTEDINPAVAVVFEEMAKLKLGVLRCGISVIDKEKRSGNIWETSTNDLGWAVQVSGDEPFDIHPLLQGAYDAWLRQEDWSYLLEGDDLTAYYKAVRDARIQLPESQFVSAESEYRRQYCFVAVYHAGGLFAFMDTAFSEEAKTVIRRFAAVFDLTYKRFLDLQKAEAQTREAQIETALERVRSRTLSMQKSGELAETAAVLFKQLIGLGIKPNRLYINIVKAETGEAEFWITDEDGSKVSMAYVDNMNNNPSFKKMFDGWKNQRKSLVMDMSGNELTNYFNYLSSIHVPFQGGLTQKRRWQYIAYFSKGFIGMASPEEQPAGTLQLLERFAYVFNLTFTRFNDLQVAEAHAVQAEQDLIEIKAARKNAEAALSELQATQKQLIQSEKMASLGELTAGIAHEIQNPLNFVNNFSEVNGELISELVDEVEKGNTEEAKAIAADIKQNLEKINHHGKRADAIVKGMLQHSRTNTGQKEPTNVNALCDEYLRLAYHGLRAKNKSFNAELKTDFDETIEKVNVIPQDIGRVLLNVINNAFYAVYEKQKLSITNYQPIVWIKTRKIADWVEISVADNGSGIPKNIVDKIFQPFFTTKPTGQGTGLGLSLAYDIVKAHGGEIKVETKEGEGSEFVILLPIH